MRPTAADRKAAQRRILDHASTVVAPKIATFLRSRGGAIAHEAAALYREARKDDADRVKQILTDLGIDLSGLSEVVLQEMIGAYQTSGETALLQVLETSRAAALFDVLNPAASEYAATRSAELVTQIEATTRDGLRSLIEDAFTEGMSPAELAASIRDGFEFSADRAEMIARTELANAHVQGTLEAWRESGVVEGKSWILSNDHPEPDECDDAADLGVVPIGDDFGGFGDPPAHPNCVLGGTVVAAAGVTAKMTRRYEGKIVRVRVEGADELAVTPNHPILTQRGWIAAGKLKKSDNLFLCRDPEDLVRFLSPYDHEMPAAVEQVFRSLLVAGGMATVGVPTTTEDFHGDGVAEGEVHIVRPARYETAKWKADRGLKRQLRVRWTRFVRTALSRDRATAEFLQRRAPAADRIVGARGATLPNGLASARGLDRPGRTVRAHVESKASEGVSYRQVVNAEAFPEIDARLASFVEPAKFLGLVRENGFSGQVYNLGTMFGFYLANGLIVHNCECDVLPELIGGEADAEAA